MGKSLVHLQISKRLSTNAINKAMREAGQNFIYNVAMPDLMAAAEAGKKAAEEGYANAKYDGVNDVAVGIDKSGPRSVELYAVGHALPYIEYGTGVFNKNNYSPDGKIKDGKNYWFFYNKGDVQLTAGGQKAHYRTGWTHERYYYEGPKGGKHYVSPDYARMSASGPYLPYEGEGGSNLTLKVETVEKPTEYHEKKHSYITHGNPPNNVMRHAMNVMLRQFNAKYKSKYSKYEP